MDDELEGFEYGDEILEEPGFKEDSGESGGNFSMSTKSSIESDVIDHVTLRELEKHRITEEFKREKRMTDNELMDVCAKEWEDSRRVAWYIWNGAKERLKILTSDEHINKTQKNDILSLILTCTDLRELITKKQILTLGEPNDPLQWIKNWKKTEATIGGRGIVVKPRTFQGQKGMNLFRNMVVDANVNTLNNLNSQVHEAVADDILPMHRNYIKNVKQLFDEDEYNNDTFIPMGEVIISPKKAEIDDLAEAMGEMSLTKKGTLKKKKKKYNVDDLIEDIQNKLQFKMDPFEMKSLHESIDNQTKNGDRNINVGQLMKTVKRTAEREALAAATNVKGLGPFEIGVKKVADDPKVYVPVYAENVHFIAPYQDPHFTFLGTDVEYWVPKVHMQTGLPVFKEKLEILRQTKTGNIVYIKRENVKVWVPSSKHYINVSYFRKFVDFNDFLKSWQETYVRQYYEIGETLESIAKTITMHANLLKKVKNYITRRRYLFYKIKDMKTYFTYEMKKQKDITEENKLCMYASDEVVRVLLSEQLPDPEIDIYSALIKLNAGDRKRKGSVPQRLLFECLKILTDFYPDLLDPEVVTKKTKHKFGRKLK